jgi:hypothetical protein
VEVCQVDRVIILLSSSSLLLECQTETRVKRINTRFNNNNNNNENHPHKLNKEIHPYQNKNKVLISQ